MKPCRYQLSSKQWRSRSAGFWRSQLIRIHTVFNASCELIIINQNIKHKCLKFHWNISDGYQVIERTRFSDGQTHEKTQGEKINMQELWFLCMTRHLNVLYKCLIFRWNISNIYQVIERTRNSIANDQRKIPQKISKAEWWFLCTTHRLNVLYKCMKFLETSLTVIKL